MLKTIFFILLIPLTLLSNNKDETNCDSIEKEWESIKTLFYHHQLESNQLNQYINRLDGYVNLECKESKLRDAYLLLLQMKIDEGNIPEAMKLTTSLQKDLGALQWDASQKTEFYILQSQMHYENNELEKTKKEINRLLEVNNPSLTTENLARLYDLKGKVFLQEFIQTKNNVFLDSANLYFNKSYTAAKTSEVLLPIFIQSSFYKNKIGVLLAKNQYEEVIKNANNALILTDHLSENHSDRTYFTINKARSYLALQKYDSTIHISNQLIINLKENQVEQKTVLFNLLYQSYEALGKKDSVNKYLALNNQYLNTLNTSKRNYLKLLYDIDITDLEKENKKMESKNTWKSYGIFSLLLLIVVGLFLFWRYDKAQKAKYLKIYNEKKEESLLFSKTPNTENEEDKNPLSEELITDFEKRLQELEKQKVFIRPDFSLSYLAKKWNTNTAYLSYYFNHIKKQSFPNYVNYLRINYIVEELYQNPILLNYSIEGLAKESGFKDASSFSKTFKKIMEMPPSFYIEQLRKEKA